MLNVVSTGMFTILALIVNFKCTQKLNVIAKISCRYFSAQCRRRYTKTAQRIFKYSDVCLLLRT